MADADPEAPGQGGDAAQDEDPQDLLGGVGRRADRVRAEDRERLLLGQSLADLLLARQRPAEEERLGPRPEAARAGCRAPTPPPWRSAGPDRSSGRGPRAAARSGPAGRPACGPGAERRPPITGSQTHAEALGEPARAGRRRGSRPGRPRRRRACASRSPRPLPCRARASSRRDRRPAAGRRCPGFRSTRRAVETERRVRGRRRSPSTRPSRSGQAIGRCVWPWSPIVPSRTARLARAIGTDVTYSQIGIARTAVDEASVAFAAAGRQGAEPGPRRVRDPADRPLDRRPGVGVEPVDLAPAEGRKVVIAGDPDRADRAAAGRPRRPVRGRSRRRRRGARRRRPDPAAASTASRATRLAWMSDRTATRIVPA